MSPEENNNPLTNGVGTNPVAPEPTAPSVPTSAEPSMESVGANSGSAGAPFGAVDSIPAVGADDSQAKTAEFVSGDPAAAKEEGADVEEQPVEPIKPAAPLPGSIGSAMSGPAVETSPALSGANNIAETTPVIGDNQTTNSIGAQPESTMPTTPLAATSDAVAPNPIAGPNTSVNSMPTMPGTMSADGAPKNKKSHTTTILLIVLAAVAVIAGVVAVILLTQKPKQQPTINQNTETSTQEEIVETNLVCEVSSTETGEPIEGIEGLTAYERELVAEYIDDELDVISSKDTFTFNDVELANNFSTIQEADYVNAYTSLGLEADPFKSSFKVTDSIVAISHDAKFEELNIENMAIFSLQADENGNVKTSVSSIKKIYEKLGYKCSLGDEEEEVDAEVESEDETIEKE